MESLESCLVALYNPMKIEKGVYHHVSLFDFLKKDKKGDTVRNELFDETGYTCKGVEDLIR